MHPKPVLMTQAELLAVLDDIRSRVDAGDSFEGNLTYAIPEAEDAPADSFDVVATYRIGNLQGQGGMRMLGEWGNPEDGAPLPTGYTRDLSEFVSRFGHIAVDVEISTPGNRGGVSRSTGASNTPALVARFLRELADDVERATPPAQNRSER